MDSQMIIVINKDKKLSNIYYNKADLEANDPMRTVKTNDLLEFLNATKAGGQGKGITEKQKEARIANLKKGRLVLEAKREKALSEESEDSD